MTKIAVACDNEMVSGHFGHCESFMIVETENNQIIKSESMPNPRHQFGFLPAFLADQGINVVICGGMGNRPFEVFNQKNVQVILGVKGDAKEAVDAYLNGSLKPDDSTVNIHLHNCGCSCHEE